MINTIVINKLLIKFIFLPVLSIGKAIVKVIAVSGQVNLTFPGQFFNVFIFEIVKKFGKYNGRKT